MSTNTIEYRIRAAVENLGEIGKLVGELDELGVSTDEVKGEVSRLAAELDQLGTRGRAGEALTELVRDAQGSADASRQAAAAVKPLALAYRQAQQAAQDEARAPLGVDSVIQPQVGNPLQQRVDGDFGLDAAGLALALAYLERIDALEQRVRELECTLPR